MYQNYYFPWLNCARRSLPRLPNKLNHCSGFGNTALARCQKMLNKKKTIILCIILFSLIITSLILIIINYNKTMFFIISN